MTTRSYRHKIVENHARTILPLCLYYIASMLVRYCLYVRTILPLCSYGIDSMTVRYDLNIATLTFLVTVTGSIDLWPIHARTVLPPWPYDMTVQYVPANIAQWISGMDISERCAIVSNRYNIVATKTLLTS